jgi:hypothetical protein
MSPVVTVTEPKPGDDRTATLRRMAWLLDDALKLPLGFRVGLDALIGLVPGLGDLVGGAASIYGLGVAWQLGAPPVVLARMVLNASVDALLGSIPFFGDLWDVGFASHRRNLAILEAWLARPDHTVGRSTFALIAAIATLVAVLIGAFVFAVWLVIWLVGKLRGE